MNKTEQIDYKQLAESLISSIDIVQFISRYYQLGKEGSGYTAINDNSIKVNPEKRIIKDFSGKVLGDKAHNVISFYAHVNNISYGKATIELAKTYGLIQDDNFTPRNIKSPVTSQIIKPVNNKYNHPVLNFIDKTKQIKLPDELRKDIVTRAWELLSQTEEHTRLIRTKRPFDIPDNYKSFDISVIDQLIKEYDRESVYNIFAFMSKKPFSLLLDRLLIFYPDDTGKKFSSFRAYSFTDNPKILSVKGSQSEVYNRHLILNPDIERIVIEEGETKADSGNFYSDNKTAFVSIPGINNHKPIIQFIQKYSELKTKEITISFDRRLDYKDRPIEEKQAYKLLKKLCNLGCENVNISFKTNELDLDDALLQIQEKSAREKYINDLLSVKYNRLEFEAEFTNNSELSKAIEQEKFRPKKRKIEYREPVTKPIEVKELNEIRELIEQDGNNWQNSTDNYTLLLNSTPGTGKSYLIEELAKKNKSCVIETDTINGRKEYHKKLEDSEELKGISQICKETTEKYNKLVCR